MVGGWAAAAAMTFLWLNARDAIIEEREGCNADKLATVAEAEAEVRRALEEVHSRRIAELARQRDQADRERIAMLERARRAEAKPAEVREVIKRVAVENECIDTAVPTAVLDKLRE